MHFPLYLEKFLSSHNLFRSLFQRKDYKRRQFVSRLLEIGGEVRGNYVLEIGCGEGIGAEILLKDFGAARVYALDLDPDQIANARKRLKKYSSQQLELVEGSACSIPVKDETFDAVFDFGISYLIPNWQKVIKEVSRVLKPGGKFYFEEITRHGLDRSSHHHKILDQSLLNHFTSYEFKSSLEKYGLWVDERFEEKLHGDIILGVAVKK